MESKIATTMTRNNCILPVLFVICSLSLNAQTTYPKDSIRPLSISISGLNELRILESGGSTSGSESNPIASGSPKGGSPFLSHYFEISSLPGEEGALIPSIRLAECWGLQVANIMGTEEGGIMIESVEPNTTGALAGLQAGDIVRAANDQPVAWWHELYRELRDCDTTSLTVHRGYAVVRLQICRPICLYGAAAGNSVLPVHAMSHAPADTVAQSLPSILSGVDSNARVASPLQVFPNPNNGKFEVQFQGSASPLTIEVVDASGVVLHTEQAKGGHFRRLFNFSSLNSRWVVVTIIQEGKIYTQRVIFAK